MTLCAQEVSVRRGGAILLDGVCAEIAPGEVVAVVGPNGAGKSTLVNLLAGDIAPGTGRVILNQEDIANIPLARRAALRAVVGPPPRIAFDFTVADVVGMSWLGGARRGIAYLRPRAHGPAHFHVTLQR